MSKKAVDKRMLYVDWTGDWRTYQIEYESEASVWYRHRLGGNLVRRNKATTDGQFYEIDAEGLAAARIRLANRAEMMRKKAGHAADQLGRLDVLIKNERYQRVQAETFKLARMKNET